MFGALFGTRSGTPCGFKSCPSHFNMLIIYPGPLMVHPVVPFYLYVAGSLWHTSDKEGFVAIYWGIERNNFPTLLIPPSHVRFNFENEEHVAENSYQMLRPLQR